MKKIVFGFILGFICLVFSSCISTAYAETYDGDDNIEVVIRYGTPYYYNNVLVYYYYNGYYFYPYRHHNVWRYHRYTRPLPPPRHNHRYDYRPNRPHQPHNGSFGRGNHERFQNGGNQPKVNNRTFGNRQSGGNVNGNNSRGNIHRVPSGVTRPSIGNHRSTFGGGQRPKLNSGGRFGGRR